MSLPYIKIMKWIVIFAGVLIFAVYIWPTPLQYFKSGPVNFRTNRITGVTQILNANGWTICKSAKPVIAVPNPPAPPSSVSLNSDELDVVVTTCNLRVENGIIEMTLHNSTNHVIMGAKISIVLYNEAIPREYILKTDFSHKEIQSLSDGSLTNIFDNSFSNTDIKSWKVEDITYLSSDIKTTNQQAATDKLDKLDSFGQSALINAAYYNNNNDVKVLLKAGANMEVKNMTGMTALIYAAINGNNDIVKQLINAGANREAKDNDGMTALMYAAEWGNADIVKMLLNAGANIKAVDKDGLTSLDHAKHPEENVSLEAKNATIDALLAAGAKE